MSNFEQAFDVIISHEGGLVDDDRDPGGITKYGISLRFLRGHYPDADPGTIKNLTKDRARDLYKTHFWDAISADDMAFPLSLMAFDMAVNQGKNAAVIDLQRALRVTPDGITGPQTRAAIQDQYGPALLCEYHARRIQRYAKTVNFERFGLGWMRRAASTYQRALRESIDCDDTNAQTRLETQYG